MKFTFETAIYRGDDELELRVTYELSPYYPATHLQPAEGGDCEILDAKFIGVTKDSPLSIEEWETLQAECEARAHQDAADAAADRADYLYEQQKDRRMMEQWESET